VCEVADLLQVAIPRQDAPIFAMMGSVMMAASSGPCLSRIARARNVVPGRNDTLQTPMRGMPSESGSSWDFRRSSCSGDGRVRSDSTGRTTRDSGLELEDFVRPGGRRQAHGQHRSFAARVREAHHLGRRNHAAERSAASLRREWQLRSASCAIAVGKTSTFFVKPLNASAAWFRRPRWCASEHGQRSYDAGHAPGARPHRAHEVPQVRGPLSRWYDPYCLNGHAIPNNSDRPKSHEDSGLGRHSRIGV